MRNATRMRSMLRPADRGLGATVQGERGQVLPLLLVVMVGLLALGVLVFQLAFSTDLAAVAQTAADAAALAGENNVVYQLEHPRPNGPIIDPAQVQAAAEGYARDNGAHVLGSVQLLGFDVLVTVQTDQGLPQGSVDAGASAVREARASTDPFASGPAPSGPGDASAPATGGFVAHGGQYGFFPAPGTNYSVGSEPEIAARLDALGKAKQLNLTGISGYRTPGHSVEVGGAADDPHTCGAASDTPGVEGVPEATLEQFGLTRPFPGDPAEADHIQLAGTSGGVCLGAGALAVGGGGALPVALGNPNPHLVPVAGGPTGVTLGGSGLGASAGWTIPFAVVNCESGGQNQPPNSASASGYYQITTGTWAGFGGYPAAYLAPKPIQDAKAAQLLATRGLEPWTSSEHCWGPLIGFLA